MSGFSVAKLPWSPTYDGCYVGGRRPVCSKPANAAEGCKMCAARLGQTYLTNRDVRTKNPASSNTPGYII